MTIKLEKKEELNGEIYYLVWADSSCIKSFLHNPNTPHYEKSAFDLATEFYNSIIEKAKEGYPKITPISQTTIQPTQP